jgi:hypothetical protein
VSLSRVQARVIVNSGLFDQQIRQALEALQAFAPVLWHLSLAKQRDRSRTVTRRKQRNRW